MSDIAQPHDRFLKMLLLNPHQAGTLLRERLPKEIAECLSEDPPELVDGTFVDEELRSHLTDRLYEVRTVRGRKAFLYVLIEHKSQPEKRIGWQLAKYQIEALKQWERENPDWDLLPAVVPFIFYHGAVQWRVPDEFLALVDAEEGWRPYLLNFRFPVFDLGQVDELSRVIRSLPLALPWPHYIGSARATDTKSQGWTCWVHTGWRFRGRSSLVNSMR